MKLEAALTYLYSSYINKIELTNSFVLFSKLSDMCNDTFENKEDVKNYWKIISKINIFECIFDKGVTEGVKYLKENNMGLDKFQLATIVMKLFCESVSSLPQPFYVQARESKNLMKDYVKANKEYMEKVKKVKRENEELLKEASKLEKQRQEAKRQINTPIEEPIVEEKIIQKRPLNIHTTAPKKNDKFKYRNHDTNTLVDTFTF